LPDIEDLLSLDEQSLLQKQPNFSATLHKLDTIMHRATMLTHQPELDVSRILEALKTEKQEETSTSMWPIILSIVICILILVIGYYNRHYLNTLKGKWINQHTTSQPKSKCRTRRNSSVNLNETLRTTVPLHVAGQMSKKLKAHHTLLLYKEEIFSLRQLSPKRMYYISIPSNNRHPFKEDEETNIDQRSTYNRRFIFTDLYTLT
jgi:hypothetical protein